MTGSQSDVNMTLTNEYAGSWNLFTGSSLHSVLDLAVHGEMFVCLCVCVCEVDYISV